LFEEIHKKLFKDSILVFDWLLKWFEKKDRDKEQQPKWTKMLKSAQ